MKNFLIDILAFATLLSAILIITSKNPVISILFLIFTFVNASGYLILSGMVFIGISYIIIYVGAIAVIFLFVIMMINIRLSSIIEVGSQYTKNIPLAIIIGYLFIYEIVTIFPFIFNNFSSPFYFLNIFNYLNLLLIPDLFLKNKVYITYNTVNADTTFIDFLQIQSIGQSLYTYSAILLIILSIILLLAMIAPIFLNSFSKQNKNSILL